MTYEEAIDILSTEVMDYIPSAATWLMGLHDLVVDGHLEAVKTVIDTWITDPGKIIDGSEKAHSRIRALPGKTRHPLYITTDRDHWWNKLSPGPDEPRVASKAPAWFEVDEV